MTTPSRFTKGTLFSTIPRVRFLLAMVGMSACPGFAAGPLPSDGVEYVGFTNLSSFTRTTNGGGATVWTSPRVTVTSGWDQLVASWNVEPAAGVRLELEARAFSGTNATRFFHLGQWTLDPAWPSWRTSKLSEPDDDGEVNTDTLVLLRPARAAELRVTIWGPEDRLRFLGLSFLNTRLTRPSHSADTSAWGKELAVPERSQMPYADGHQLCSPAVISMLLAYWSAERGRPDWDRTVPEIARGVWDETWGGAGNWTFNMAYVGSLGGLRAYVARFADFAEVERWVAAGVPVALSLCYNRLRGKSGPRSGHLVICRGITPSGDVVLNDPGTTLNVRKVFPRENVRNAWTNSRQTVYLVYPLGTRTPTPSSGHWFSEGSGGD
jgi:hypothetical protein